MTAEMPNSRVTWDQPDDELDELAAPDADLLADDLSADPAQTAETDFFWEDDEE
ncbi:hypothetical protein [Dactylosporangium sp. CS-033363]|uniref:hypothetical protein n=1 Tax=unclassified Dactylosporangium TaxID=2621675 RepID=UPI003D8F8A55